MLASLHSMSRTVGCRLESVQSEAACFRGSPVFGDHMLLLGDTAGSEHTLAALQQAVLRRAREIYSAFAGAPKLSLDKALQMGAKEANNRRARDLSFVSTHPSALWTKTILGDLKHLDEKRGK